MLRTGWVVLIVTWAAPASAQFVCSGSVCFTSAEGCEERRVHELDEGVRAPPCAPVERMHCVEAWDETEGDTAMWCQPTPSACNARIRELQRLNRRSRRHLYSHIGTCSALEYDADGDGVRWDMDECDDQAGTASTRGCPDGDGDGWADAIDRCPAEIGTLNGCPDGDGDGVADSVDRCPDLRGMVHLEGCVPTPERGPARIDEGAARAAMLDAVAFARSCPVERILILEGDAAVGYWVRACGNQLLFQLEDGRWSDRTPP